MTDLIFARTCQECGHTQKSKPIEEYKGTSWTETKCRKCKSEALDYGSQSFVEKDGKLVRFVEEDEE